MYWSSHAVGVVGQLHQRRREDPGLGRGDVRIVCEMDNRLAQVHSCAGLANRDRPLGAVPTGDLVGCGLVVECGGVG
jgi:hypothetical protein